MKSHGSGIQDFRVGNCIAAFLGENPEPALILRMLLRMRTWRRACRFRRTSFPLDASRPVNGVALHPMVHLERLVALFLCSSNRDACRILGQNVFQSLKLGTGNEKKARISLCKWNSFRFPRPVGDRDRILHCCSPQQWERIIGDVEEFRQAPVSEVRICLNLAWATAAISIESGSYELYPREE